MRAGFTTMHAGMVAAALIPLTVLGNALTGLVFAVVLCAAASGLACSYVGAFKRRPRHSNWPEEPRHTRWIAARVGERMVLLAWLGATLPVIAIAIVELCNSSELVHFVDPRGASYVLSPLAFAAGSMLISSLIDWYLTVPQLSGLVREPPCLAPDDGHWATVTQRLLVHRWLATFAVIAGLWVGLAALVGVLAYHGALSLLRGSELSGTDSLAALIGGVFAVVVPAVGWVGGLIGLTAGDYLPAMKAGTTRALHPPFAIGQYRSVRVDQASRYDGYLLDVALEAITLVPLDSIGTGEDRPLPTRMLSVSELQNAGFDPLSGPYCDSEKCLFVNERYCLRARALRTSSNS
jgi:hypothetical protein